MSWCEKDSFQCNPTQCILRVASHISKGRSCLIVSEKRSLKWRRGDEFKNCKFRDTKPVRTSLSLLCHTVCAVCMYVLCVQNMLYKRIAQVIACFTFNLMFLVCHCLSRDPSPFKRENKANKHHVIFLHFYYNAKITAGHPFQTKVKSAKDVALSACVLEHTELHCIYIMHEAFKYPFCVYLHLHLHLHLCI